MSQLDQHLSLDDLILFLDRELDTKSAALAEQHLLACRDCAQQLRSLKTGSEAYSEYREAVLKPALAVPTSGWARLSQQVETETRRRWVWVWAAACACGLAVAFVLWRVPGQPSAQEVLNHATAAPEYSNTGSLLLVAGRDRWVRPAVLESGHSEARFQHVRALFVQANYSWENPLSARSFARWRDELPQKEDAVTTLRERDGRRYFRVETRTNGGVLKSAALTLQDQTYHPTKADFAFRGEEAVELSEQQETPKNGLEEVHESPAGPAKPLLETPATPEDELRVFAALDAMGAEAEEPIDVKLDGEHHTVLVTGTGLSAARRREIETAMAGLPRTVIRFSAGQRLSNDADSLSGGNSAEPDESLAFRQGLQDRYGGARQLQAATDQALETSNALFARAHFLLILAREFPPGVEAALNVNSATSLLALRQRHVGAMEYAMRQLKEELRPLAVEATIENNEPMAKNGAAWQSGAETLLTSARNLDRLVSRLLSGRYSEQEGNNILKELPGELSRVETLIRAQSDSR